MRLIFSLLAVLFTSVNAAPSKPSVADQIRHPRGNRWLAAIVRQPVSGSATSTSATRTATKSSLLVSPETLPQRMLWEGFFCLSGSRCRTRSLHTSSYGHGCMVAEMERRFILERQRAGIEADGVYKGRKPSVSVEIVRKMRKDGHLPDVKCSSDLRRPLTGIRLSRSRTAASD